MAFTGRAVFANYIIAFGKAVIWLINPPCKYCGTSATRQPFHQAGRWRYEFSSCWGGSYVC